MSNFTNFRVVYDELTDEVMRATLQFLPEHIKAWFKHLEATPKVSAVIHQLEFGLDIERWAAQAMADRGFRNLDWGTEEDEKLLGMKLGLFRAFGQGKQDISLFGYIFLHVNQNRNDNARAFVQQVFAPMARELRRFLESEVARPEVEDAGDIPASDRQVSVDHNSKEYTDAEAAIEKLETAIRETNDFSEPEEKEQREAEVAAARRLLRAVRVRLEPLAALLRPILVQYVNKVKDNLVAAAALATVAALGALLGSVFKALLGL